MTSPQTLFVVADPAAVTSMEANIIARLTGQGQVVTTVSQSASESTSVAGKNLIFIGTSVDTSVLGTKYVTAGQPLIALGSWSTYSLASTMASAGSQSQIYINDATVAKIPTGLTTTYTAASTIRYGTVLGAGGINVAYQNTQPARATIVAYPKGGLLYNGAAAAGKRVGLGIASFGFDTLNTTGLTLFDTMVAWALGTPVSMVKLRGNGAWFEKPAKVRVAGSWK